MRAHGKSLAILAAAVAAAILLPTFRGQESAQQVEASFTSPGGIAILPSAIPGLPGVPTKAAGVAQPLPAFAPASGPGSLAIAIAFCDTIPVTPAACPRSRVRDPLQVGPPSITFTLNKLFPPGEPVRASFADIVARGPSGFGEPVATGKTTLVCTDDAACDLSDAVFEEIQANAQHVAVAITGGGANEVLEVEACDGTGDCRSAQLFFVESIIALLPLGPSSAPSPHVVTYACQSTGLYSGLAAPDIDTDEVDDFGAGITASLRVTWEEVYLWMYGTLPWAGGVGATGGRLRNPLSDRPLPDIPFYSCGGNTSSVIDDRVNFETDRGIFSIEGPADGAGTLTGLPSGDLRPIGTLSNGCDVGDSVNIIDHPGPVLNTRGPSDLLPGDVLPPVPATFCDLDFAPNGVVTYALQGTGDVDVASITAQQSGLGGATVPRNINLTFTGPPGISLFLTAPDQMGFEGGTFSVVVIDTKFRPLGGHPVECTASPKEAGFLIIPQTGTTQGLLDPNPGQVVFHVTPTPSAITEGVDLIITCVVDEDRERKAVKVVKLLGKPVRETVDLEAGCDLVSFMPNYDEGEGLAAVAGDIAGGTPVLWFQRDATDFDLFDPASEERSTITTLDREAGFICVAEDTTWNRPAAVQDMADLSVELEDSPDPVVPGEVLTYTATVSNPEGSAFAKDVVVELRLPEGVEIEELPDGCSGGVPGDQDEPVVCTPPAGTFGAAPGLQPNSSWEVTIEVRVKRSVRVGTVLAAEVSVSTTSFDPDRTNNSGSESTTVGRPLIP